MNEFRYKLVLQRIAILVLMASIVTYIMYNIGSLKRYYTEHTITEVGMCTEYICAVKLDDVFATVSGPVMVGQTVYIHCANYTTDEVDCDSYAQIHIRDKYIEKTEWERQQARSDSD